MPDPVHLIYSAESIDNGGARVQAPKGLGVDAVTGVLAPNYEIDTYSTCLLYTSPSPRDKRQARMPSSA